MVGSTVSSASITTIRTSLSFRWCRRQSTGRQSFSSPASSMPVKPAPATTKVRYSARSFGSGSAAARRNMSSTCRRMRSASSNDQSVRANSLMPGMPKNSGSPPAPITR